MLTIRRESLDIPQGRRILAVSDIHGHVHFLKKVLERAGFCEADELIIDGDIIEKGPYSLETLRYVMELGKLPNVHVISGNVDCWQLELIGSREPEMTRALAEFIQTAKERWGGSLFLDFCDEMGIGLWAGGAGIPVRTAFHRGSGQFYLCTRRASKWLGRDGRTGGHSGFKVRRFSEQRRKFRPLRRGRPLARLPLPS